MDRPIFTRHDPIYSSSLISSGNRKKDTLRMNQPTRKIKRILIYCYYYFLALIKPNSQRCGALGEKTLFCWRRGGDSPFIKMSIASAHTHRDRGGGCRRRRSGLTHLDRGGGDFLRTAVMQPLYTNRAVTQRSSSGKPQESHYFLTMGATEEQYIINIWDQGNKREEHNL